MTCLLALLLLLTVLPLAVLVLALGLFGAACAELEQSFDGDEGDGEPPDLHTPFPI